MIDEKRKQELQAKVRAGQTIYADTQEEADYACELYVAEGLDGDDAVSLIKVAEQQRKEEVMKSRAAFECMRMASEELRYTGQILSRGLVIELALQYGARMPDMTREYLETLMDKPLVEFLCA